MYVINYFQCSEYNDGVANITISLLFSFRFTPVPSGPILTDPQRDNKGINNFGAIIPFVNQIRLYHVFPP